MILGYPYYYRYFKCIADKCRDNCCMHWEIDIDDNTLNKYLTWQDSFREQLAENICINSEGGHFKMDKDEKCCFLNADGLCSLILNIGEENLCDICREHPRFYNSFSFGDEVGIGLCCETAAGLILDSSIPDNIVYTSVTDTYPETAAGTVLYENPVSVPDPEAGPEPQEFPDYETAFLKERDILYTDGSYFSALWGEAGKNLYEDSFAEYFYQVDAVRSLSDLLLSLEILSGDWKSRVLKAGRMSDLILSRRKEFIRTFSFVKDQYIRLVHYFIYRYYSSILYAEDMGSESEIKLLFIQICVGTIILLDTLEWIETGTFTSEQQVQICKLFSQEIEYDEDNVYALEDFACGILPV